ncbi:MAG: hypothetical protein FJW32_14855 [Acidobacteria bacterium]|nr:hypothetical protein [Acidobacteriota bacterium]
MARVWTQGVKAEALRFIPLEQEDKPLRKGGRRLRITKAKENGKKPDLDEWDLKPFAGRTVALDITGYDEQWVYGCVDVARYQL